MGHCNVFIDPPCGDCKYRTPGCHGDCESYKEFKKELEKRKAQKDKYILDRYGIVKK